MKLTLVELVSQFFLSAGAQLLDFQHADFVGAGLTGRDNITFDFRFNFLLAHSGFLAHVSDRLLARPALCMNARIDYQPDCAKKFVTQASQVSEWIVVVHPACLASHSQYSAQPSMYAVNGITLRNCGTPLSSSAVEICQW